MLAVWVYMSDGALPYLRLSRVALMAGHADLIEEAVEAFDDGGNLL
jgi:hypothetical protein